MNNFALAPRSAFCMPFEFALMVCAIRLSYIVPLFLEELKNDKN